LFLWPCLPAAGEGLLPSVRSRLPERAVERPTSVPSDAELESSGAVIGDVRLVRLNVFDPAIPEENIPLFRFVNRIHIVSRESAIASQLLFRPGDRYDASMLKETERRLRSNGYLIDARIRPVGYADGKVDLEVLTQDTWTLKPEFGFGRKGGKNKTSIGVEEQNFLGTGARFAFIREQNVDRKTRTLEYEDANLNAQHWQLAAQLANSSDGRKHALKVERPFYALDTRWSAGVSLRDETRIDSVYDLGQIVEQFHTREREATAYGGWSAGLHDGWAVRWTSGITLDERRASDIDGATPAPRLPTDRRLVYPWIGVEVVEEDFREERNFDLIGRVEDLTLGWQAKLRLGLASRALGSDAGALVFDGSASKGFQPDRAHTLLMSASAKGRVEHGALADAVFGVTTRYHWRQTPRYTFFTSLAVDHGVNLDVDKQLTLGGDNGLRGYPIRYRTGQGRWLFTAEERTFSNWYPFRLFTVGAAVFFDMGGVSGSSLVPAMPVSGPNRKVLKDIGFGLRLGNMRSAMGDVVHIDVAHPLDGDPSISRVQFIVEGKRTF
jgi:outer membrane protein assembly factor BamA